MSTATAGTAALTVVAWADARPGAYGVVHANQYHLLTPEHRAPYSVALVRLDEVQARLLRHVGNGGGKARAAQQAALLQAVHNLLRIKDYSDRAKDPATPPDEAEYLRTAHAAAAPAAWVALRAALRAALTALEGSK